MAKPSIVILHLAPSVPGLRGLSAVMVVAVVLAGCAGHGKTSSSDSSSSTSAPAPPAPPRVNVAAPQIGQGQLFATGHAAGEPSLAVTSGGSVYVTSLEVSSVPGQAFGDIRTGLLRSDDGGKTWLDVSPSLPDRSTSPQPSTSDPFFYQDPLTGRLFVLDQQGVSCNLLSTSTDGAKSWNPPVPACPTPLTDHPSLVASPPLTLPAGLYPNYVYLCESTVVSVACNQSTDGGLTFAGIAAPFPVPDDCSGLVGHLAAGRDGTVYLPKNECGVVQIGATIDDGTTWTVSSIGGAKTAAEAIDPAIAVDQADSLYATFMDDASGIVVSRSTDHGKTWSTPVGILPANLTAGNLPAMAAGTPGLVAVAYYGTESGGGFGNASAVWDGYLAIGDFTQDPVVFRTARVGPVGDPLVRGPCGPGRCQNVLDFISVAFDPEMRAWGAFVDTCVEACAAAGGTSSQSNANAGVVAMWDGR
ncbi:MAG: sialidase family protein [bacterium]